MKYKKTHHTESFFGLFLSKGFTPGIEYYLNLRKQKNKYKYTITVTTERYTHAPPHTHIHRRVTSVQSASGNGLGNGSSGEAENLSLFFNIWYCFTMYHSVYCFYFVSFKFLFSHLCTSVRQSAKTLLRHLTTRGCPYCIYYCTISTTVILIGSAVR